MCQTHALLTLGTTNSQRHWLGVPGMNWERGSCEFAIVGRAHRELSRSSHDIVSQLIEALRSWLELAQAGEVIAERLYFRVKVNVYSILLLVGCCGLALENE